MRKIFFTIGIIGLVLAGIFYFLSFPSDKKISENGMHRAVMMDYSRAAGDREGYEKAKNSDPEARYPNCVLVSNRSFGVGGLLLILGFIFGPEKKND